MLRDCPKAYAIKAAEVAQKKIVFFFPQSFLFYGRVLVDISYKQRPPRALAYIKNEYFLSSFFFLSVGVLLPPLVTCKVVSIFLPFVIGCKRVGICLGDTRGNYIAKAV